MAARECIILAPQPSGQVACLQGCWARYVRCDSASLGGSDTAAFVDWRIASSIRSKGAQVIIDQEELV